MYNSSETSSALVQCMRAQLFISLDLKHQTFLSQDVFTLTIVLPM